jgi:hypothetical protein
MSFILHRKLLFNTLKNFFPGDRPTVWYSTKAGQTSGGCQSDGPPRAPEPVPKPQTTLGSTGIEQWQSAFTMEVPRVERPRNCATNARSNCAIRKWKCTRLEHVIEEAPPKVQKATDEVLRPVRTVEVTRLTHREQPPSAHSPHSPEDPKPLVPSQPVDMTPHCSDPHCSDSDDPNVHLRQLLLKALDHEHDQAKRERAQIKHERQRHKQLVCDIKQQTRDIRQETRIKEEQLMEDKSKIARLEQELRRCLEEEAIRESEHHAEEQKLDQTTSVSGS